MSEPLPPGVEETSRTHLAFMAHDRFHDSP